MVGNVLPLRSIPKELSFATSNTTLVIVGFSLGLLVIMPLLLVTTLITTLSVGRTGEDIIPHAELFVNGEIVQRALERQRRVEPKPQRAQDRPRYNDWTRYVRRRENMRLDDTPWDLQTIHPTMLISILTFYLFIFHVVYICHLENNSTENFNSLFIFVFFSNAIFQIFSFEFPIPSEF
ncbi:hypothetical protein V6Z11_D05G354400 [Gossypium hirsutum]